MDFQFTIKDIVISAVLAYFATLLLIYSWGVLTRKRQAFSNRSRDIGRILQRRYRLFPIDIIQFHGETFHRGMRVHVTTNQQKDFEGQLIGLSKENMICVLTSKYIIAQELNKIQSMYECGQQPTA